MSWLTIHMNMEIIYEMDFIYDDSTEPDIRFQF